MLSLALPGGYYFNPRPPRGGRLIEKVSTADTREISIHVLREEDDFPYAVQWPVPPAISIHVLREEDDCNNSSRSVPHNHFNPRPPRGGRRDFLPQPFGAINFNPRPPRGGRLSFISCR